MAKDDKWVARYSFTEAVLRTYLRDKYPEISDEDIWMIIDDSQWSLSPEGKLTISFRAPIKAEQVQIEIVKKL